MTARHISLLAALVCVGAAAAADTETVTYSNSLLSQMASALVHPNRTLETETEEVFDTMRSCKAAAKRSVYSTYVSTIHANTATYYKVTGYDPTEFLRARCDPTPSNSDEGPATTSTWTLNFRRFTYAEPVWAPDATTTTAGDNAQ